jgi:hypothetical protein
VYATNGNITIDPEEHLMPYPISAVEQVQRQFACEYCGAQPGEPCRNLRSRVIPAHNDRFVKARAAGLLPLKDGGGP